MQELPLYQWEEIQKHDKDDDCWVVMYGKVLDVTQWLNEHPGGLDPIKDLAGRDITNSFESIGHSSTALVKSKSMIVGRVDPTSKEITGREIATEPPKKWSEMSKEELYTYKAGGDIISPRTIIAILLAVVALVYMLW